MEVTWCRIGRQTKWNKSGGNINVALSASCPPEQDGGIESKPVTTLIGITYMRSNSVLRWCLSRISSRVESERGMSEIFSDRSASSFRLFTIGLPRNSTSRFDRNRSSPASTRSKDHEDENAWRKSQTEAHRCKCKYTEGNRYITAGVGVSPENISPAQLKEFSMPSSFDSSFNFSFDENPQFSCWSAWEKKLHIKS